MRKILFLFLFLLIYFASCKKISEKYSIVPSIKFISIQKPVNGPFGVKGTVGIVFYYKDGDGDFGQATNDNDNRLLATAYTIYWNNVGVKKVDTTDVSRKLVPYIENPFKLQKEGRIEIQLPYSFTSDSISYKIRIKDRANHLSNEILTPVVYLK